jgi:hypothetical protein
MAKWKLVDAPYFWDLKTSFIRFRAQDYDVVAELCCVGTASKCEGTFLWSWANETIPPSSRRELDRVQEFGKKNDLSLLITPEWKGGEAEGKEMVAVAGRILDADGTWIDKSGDLTLFFVLSRFREEPPSVTTAQ